MNTLQFFVQTVIGIYLFILVARAWFQYCRVDFYNPLAQTLVKLTQPVLLPLKKVIPSRYNIDFSVIVLTFLIGSLKLPLFFWLQTTTAPSMDLTNISIYGLIGLLTLVKTFGTMIFWAIFIRAIGSWFSRGNSQMDYLLYQITEPLLAPIRRVLPNTGMLDFSVMLLGFILILGNNLLLNYFEQLWLLA